MNLNPIDSKTIAQDGLVSIPIRDLMNLNLQVDGSIKIELKSFNPY